LWLVSGARAHRSCAAPDAVPTSGVQWSSSAPGAMDACCAVSKRRAFRFEALRSAQIAVESPGGNA
jgi:hypothetical protein